MIIAVPSMNGSKYAQVAFVCLRINASLRKNRETSKKKKQHFSYSHL